MEMQEESSVEQKLHEEFSGLNYFVTVVFFIGLYAGIDIYVSGKLLVPNILCGVTAIYFLAVNRSKIRKAHIKILLLIFGITVLNILFTEGNELFLLEKIKGLVQLVYSIVIGYALYMNLEKKRPDRIKGIFLLMLAVLIAGLFLERFSPLKNISDDFRFMVFNESYLYLNDYRDIEIYGSIRPKLFTSEPSHVAHFLLISLFLIYALAARARDKLLVIMLTVVCFFLVKSPIVLLLYPGVVVIETFLKKRKHKETLNLKKYGKELVTMFVALLLMGVILFTSLGERMGRIAQGDDESFMVRNIAGVYIMKNMLKESPLWGSGITGKEAIEDIVQESYLEMGLSRYSLYSFCSNYLHIFVIYYGIVGSILFAIAFMMMVSRLGRENVKFILASILLFSVTMGAFVNVKTWSYIFLILVIEKLSQEIKGGDMLNVSYGKLA